MQICMVGLNHKTASIELREAVSVTRAYREDALHGLCSRPGIQGAVVLSTCNRMEIYVDADDADAAFEQVCAFISDFKHIDRAAFEPHLYRHEGDAAVRHLFGVVASLDSMVLGEQQITGQVREAFKQALEADTCTLALAQLFRQALTCGKRVRTETEISESHVSISTVAVDLAKEEFDNFEDKTVLVVGSGEMSRLAAQYLHELGVHSFIVSSRTFAHAREVADALGGKVRPFSELRELLCEADIVISSTASSHCVIVPSMLAHCGHHILILDIALPRDVAQGCRDVEGVTVYDLDDIDRKIRENQQKRRDAAEAARAVVEEEAQGFSAWVAQHAVVPTIKRMRADAEAMREHEVEHLLRALSVRLADEDRAALDAATRAIVNKLLHTPTVRMKESSAEGVGLECMEAARYLFGYADEMASKVARASDDAAADEGAGLAAASREG